MPVELFVTRAPEGANTVLMPTVGFRPDAPQHEAVSRPIFPARVGIATEEPRRKLEDILIELGAKPKHVRHALERRSVTHESLPAIVRDIGLVSGETVARALAIEAGVDYLPPEAVETLDVAVLRRYAEAMKTLRPYVPVGINDRGGVLLAVDSMQHATAARNAFHDQMPAIVLASETTIQAIYRRYFSNTLAALDEALTAVAAAIANKTDTDNPGLIQEVMGAILRHACYQGASDIYLWRSDLAGKLKVKRDGTGEMVRTLTVEVFDRLLTMLVGNAGVGDALSQGPVECRVQLSAPSVAASFADIMDRYNFRMELVQEKNKDKTLNAVIRVQDSQAQETDFAAIGFDAAATRTLRRWIDSPTGLILVTGPTGSGKTTTLYSMLKEIDPIDRQVVTVENPIEYRNRAWLQHEIRAKNQEDEGHQSRSYLKAMLRQAPDVILIGEVRDDIEVVKTLFGAANTGHLVFTTLHTNSAAGAILRLKKLGGSIEEIAATLRGVVAQRLIPVLCPHCKRPDDRASTLEELDRTWLSRVEKTPMLADGCDHCGGTGIRGRRMVYEVLEAHLVQALIERDAPMTEIQKRGIGPGQSMWARGLVLVAQGLVAMDDLSKRVDRDYE